MRVRNKDRLPKAEESVSKERSPIGWGVFYAIITGILVFVAVKIIPWWIIIDMF